MASTTYRSVAANVYKDGNSYRVRVTHKGKLISKNFATKKAALEFRSKYR